MSIEDKRKLLGNLIRQRRCEKNIKVVEFAEMMNVTRKAVYDWEAGVSEPKITFFFRISKILELDIEEVEKVVGDDA